MKRFQLPLQKGTEKFPQVMQQPTKLVISGVQTGTPLYHAVAQQFGGHLKAFHGRAQQNYSLSDQQQMKFRKAIPGARMSYQNNQGQEILHLKVDHVVLKEIEKKIPPVPVPWDWVVIDFETVLTPHTYAGADTASAALATFYAKMIAPHPNISKPKADPAAEYAAAGEHIAYQISAETHPILQWASGKLKPQVGTTVTDIGAIETDSLLIDMRDFHTYEEMVFEIYGNVEAMVDDYNTIQLEATYYGYIQLASTPADLIIAGESTYSTATITGTTGVVPASTPSPYTDYVDDSAVPLDLPRHGLGVAWPPIINGGRLDLATGLLVDLSTVFNVPIPQGVGNNITVWPDSVIMNFHENVLHYVFAREYTYDATPFPVVSDTITNLKYAVFRGDPAWGWSEHIDSATGTYSERWENARTYPARFKLGRLGNALSMNSQSISDLGPENNHGLTFLGRLSVSPKRGGVSWRPA